MRKIIARILAFVVCAVAAVLIYYGVKDAYIKESLNDFIEQGENFAQGKVVEPSEVEDNTANGKFVHAIVVYWRSFQDINNELDTETNKMLGAFDPKKLATPDSIKTSLEQMEEFRAMVEQSGARLDKNAQQLIASLAELESNKSLIIGSVKEIKADLPYDDQFRKDISDIRKTIASYMYAGLEFLYSRQATLSFAENGAINFASEADQKYFYDLMAVVSQANEMLKANLAQNREDIRANVSSFKDAFYKATK